MHKPMKQIESLTNEILGKQCLSSFDTVGRAIKIAKYLITAGKVPDAWGDNVAAAVLRLMADQGCDEVERSFYKE
jgi:hypothetical protein